MVERKKCISTLLVRLFLDVVVGWDGCSRLFISDPGIRFTAACIILDILALLVVRRLNGGKYVSIHWYGRSFMKWKC